jgi:hypothetical protein
MSWYGAQARWFYPFEREAQRTHGLRLTSHLAKGRRLIYEHSGLEVPGRSDVPVRVEFYASAPYDTFGLDPQDYPRVFADPKARSKHRMSDDALCLYAPFDPPEDRWTSSDGLLLLLNLVVDHLFSEMVWRDSGVWPRPESPHGLPEQWAA